VEALNPSLLRGLKKKEEEEEEGRRRALEATMRAALTLSNADIRRGEWRGRRRERGRKVSS